MKIAVISDIHANALALESVLADIEEQEAEKIFCLGDIVMAGPEPQKTYERIKELSKHGNFTIIQGNTDTYVATKDFAVSDNIKTNNLVMGNACEADMKELSDDCFEFLKKLPPQKEITIGNVKILLVHGSPRSNVENIFPGMAVEKVEEMIKDTDADIVFCGHTHQPCGYQTNTKQTVVNAGSVGRPVSENPKACYAVLEILDADKKEFVISHRLVDYDREKSAELVKVRKFDGADKLAKMLIGTSERYPS